jgi:hypothetical protein
VGRIQAGDLACLRLLRRLATARKASSRRCVYHLHSYRTLRINSLPLYCALPAPFSAPLSSSHFSLRQLLLRNDPLRAALSFRANLSVELPQDETRPQIRLPTGPLISCPNT